MEASQEQDRRFHLGRLGGLTALVLGGVYAYGALLKSTELHGAGLSVKDTLPLIPLEQILVAGIGSALIYGAMVIFMGLFVAVVAEQRIRRIERDEPEKGKVSERLDRFWSQNPWWLQALLIVGWIYLLLSSPWFIFLTLAAVVLIGWVTESKDVRFGFVVGIVALTIGASTLTIAYFAPPPLPKAVVKTDEGTVRGRLIATTGSVYYIGEKDGKFRVIQADETQSALFDPEKNEHEDDSIFKALTGRSLQP